jgi:threonine synthase
MFLTHLSCTSCGLHHDWTKLQNLCTACRKPLLAVYDLEQAGRALRRKELSTRAEKSLWRYRELLPVPIETAPVSLGEGGTPLLRAGTFGASLQNHASNFSATYLITFPVSYF